MMLEPQHRQILHLLHTQNGLSRTELAQAMHVSKAAISLIIRNMLDKQLITESDTTIHGQGRPSIQLKVNSTHCFFLGIALTGEQVDMAILDLSEQVYRQISFPIVLSPKQLACQIAEQIPELITQSHIEQSHIIAVGVTLSGLINETRDTCLQSTSLGWDNVPFATFLREQIDLPVYLENDAKSLAIEQKLFGQAKKSTNFTLITHSDNIGSAQFIHSQLHRGAHGGAGEIAHMTIEPGQLPCRCGKRGCLDTIASLNAIRNMARQHHLNETELPALEMLAKKSNSEAIAILHRAGTALGLAISHIIQINDPQLVLIAHHADCFDGLFQTTMMQSIDTHVLPSVAGRTQIQGFELNPLIWVKAAGSIAMYQYLTDTI